MMTDKPDLTNPENLKFKDCSDDWKRAFFEATVIEGRSWRAQGLGERSTAYGTPSFLPDYIYYIPPQAPTIPDALWELFPDAQWVTVGPGGTLLSVWDCEPSKAIGHWAAREPRIASFKPKNIKGFHRGDLPWDQCLVQRPEGV